jgi:hypothetical protein
MRSNLPQGMREGKTLCINFLFAAKSQEHNELGGDVNDSAALDTVKIAARREAGFILIPCKRLKAARSCSALERSS